MTGIERAAISYVSRCRRAGDERPVYELLCEIVQPGLAHELGRMWTI